MKKIILIIIFLLIVPFTICIATNKIQEKNNTVEIMVTVKVIARENPMTYYGTFIKKKELSDEYTVILQDEQNIIYTFHSFGICNNDDNIKTLYLVTKVDHKYKMNQNFLLGRTILLKIIEIK